MHDALELAASPDVGCGNFLHVLVASRSATAPAWVHEPLSWLDRELVDPTGGVHRTLSPEALKHVVDEVAAWYWRAGIRPRDIVGVFVDESIEYFVHFIALSGLGAIPLLVNDIMPPAIAALYLRKVGPARVFVDAAHEALLTPHLTPAERDRLLRMDRSEPSAALPQPYPYRHAPDDVVLLCHTSGTTGLPKSVMFSHHGFFFGIREQLKNAFISGTHRDVSAFPQSHSAGIFRLMLSLFDGFPVLVSSRHEAASVLPQVAAFAATRLFGFPRTFVDIAEYPDVGAHDLRSLQFWVNTGDAIHESHIRRLVQLGGDGGSTFVDRFGSSEQGGALFKQEHRRDDGSFDRCIGTPLDWVEAVILDENGQPQAPGRPGLLAVKAPSVTPGYWQDPELTARFRLGDYWLTGDVARRDEHGRFFHLDRTVDAIRTRDGVAYSVELEERIQRDCDDVEECTVIGVETADGSHAPVAVVRVARGSAGDAAALLEACNRICARNHYPLLAEVIVATAADIPVGATGKVLKRELREKYRGLLLERRS